ncbi:MAG: hypothetical protein K8U57_34765 [Planctomycetes bacterium]|nr:hypothetical protein [Planctomycetota bacterium]
MSPYSARMKAHLSRYKRERLGIDEDGVWLNNGEAYPHILPERLARLNVIETIRSEFWRYFDAHSATLPLHKDFHHLNSSQAFAFNLLFPWMEADGLQGELFAALGLEPRVARTWTFEGMPDQAERTTFDLHVEFANDSRLLVEVKLTEEQFGGCVPAATHREKLRDTYAPRLASKVTSESLEEATFFLYYQLFRNVSHLDVDRGDVLVLLVPRANALTWQQAEIFRQRYLVEHVRKAVRMVAAEDFVVSLGREGTTPRRCRRTWRCFARSTSRPRICKPSGKIVAGGAVPRGSFHVHRRYVLRAGVALDRVPVDGESTPFSRRVGPQT